MEQIQKDLHRTAPGHARVEQLCKKLSRVLHAYAVRNPAIGYCQGMNFVAAIALSAMREDQAFWLVAYLVEALQPDMFGSLSAAIVDVQVFGSIWGLPLGIGTSCGGSRGGHRIGRHISWGHPLGANTEQIHIFSGFSQLLV